MDTIAQLNTSLAGRYALERELGAGGMATVYLAADLRHDRRVALKVLRPELSAVIGAERFLAEIKTTANLQHPHILPLFDSGVVSPERGEGPALLFYVMPYVEGESLRDRLTREKQLPVEEAVRIANEVLSALDYAHRHGVVHRDIKPENILLHDGQALVADFGIALAVSTAGGGTRMTETGMSLGTPHYMSPEQAMGEREITPKSDVYALGCVLYEMLVGEPPFTGPSAQAIIARVVTEEPRSLTIQRKTIPPHVEAAVRTALQKLPADRYQSAAQFAEALAKTDYVPSATHAASAVAARERGSRRLATLLPWGLLIVAAAAGAWGWLKPAKSVVSRERIVLWEKQQVPPGRIGGGLAISPDGGTIVFMEGAAGAFQLFAKERDRIETTVLAGTAGVQGGPVFSPDGEWIAFVADGKVKKVPRRGGSAITVADSANTVVPAVAWLEGGTVLFNDGAFNLLAVGQDGGASRRVFHVDSTRRGIVSVTGLPGGHAALVGACTFGCPQMDLRVLDLRSLKARVLSDEVFKGWFLPGGQVVFVRRDGGVFAAPFDLGKLDFTSPPTPVLEGVRTIAFAADMALSASGTLIYAQGGVSGAASSEVVWVTRTGSAASIDSGWAFTPAGSGGIALSPDGRRLALAIQSSAHSDIWIKELDRGPLTRLTFEGINIRPVWTADGRSVMHSSAAGLAPADLQRRRADGTGAVETLLAGKRAVYEVAPTRDSMQLVLRVQSPPSRDIVGWRRGDSTITPLVATPAFDETAPALSPDGRWLAYVSNESGREEVYVRPYPDVNAGRWQVSRNGGAEPTWAHSGRELFYINGSGGLVAAKVNAGPAFSLGEQPVLFDASAFQRQAGYRGYAVAPDDKRFVFMRPVGAQGTASLVSLVQVTNWLSELRAHSATRAAKQ